jgi:hypothetical protein
VQQVKVLSNDADASVIEVSGEDQLRWTVMVSNSPPSATAHHRVSAAGRTYEWTGNYAVQGVQPLR